MFRAIRSVSCVDCLREAGIPDGVVNVVHVNREDGWEVLESIIKHPAVRLASFPLDYPFWMI